MRGLLRNLIWIAFLATPTALKAQVMDFKNILKLPATINSPYEETMPILGPDGKTLYFTRLLHPENIGGEHGGSDIWISHGNALTGNWGPASNRTLSFNSKGNNSLAGLNRKGDVAYMLNTWGLFFSKKSDGGWLKPEAIHIPDFKPDGFTGVYVCPDYDIILISMSGDDTEGEEDIYVSLRNDKGLWSAPKNLGPTINTKGFEISPFLSPNKKRLYFSSSGHAGLGDADIYYSDRLYDSWDIWSAPINLGSEINSSFFDAYFSIYGDSLALFASSKAGVMGDIYQARVTLLNSSADKPRKFLSETETTELVGVATLEVKFERDITALNTAQNELLFYIVSKIITIPDIKIYLQTNPSGGELLQARIDAVIEKLKLLGLGGYRIDSARDSKQTDVPEGTVKVSFFR